MCDVHGVTATAVSAEATATPISPEMAAAAATANAAAAAATAAAVQQQQQHTMTAEQVSQAISDVSPVLAANVNANVAELARAVAVRMASRLCRPTA